MNILISALEWVMNGCYAICKNYGGAILLFTLLSKIVLLPLSVWLQKNSIKMVKMQPEINFLKAKYYGDKDTIAEEQSKIYKREKYNPLASVFPLVIQIILLMGLIEVIKKGMSNPDIDMMFLGMNLSLVPSQEGIGLLYSPIIAGVSAWLLCVAQNAANVLQAEQSKANKYGSMLFSVALSLYLGWFVAVGVALYWVASNLFAILQLYALNWAINPKDYVDYEALEKSKKALNELGSIGKKKRKLFGDEETKREKADYKKFFSVVNKKLVFYSESSGFYKYYKGLIEYLLEHTNIIIHYITSDYHDQIFELAKTEQRIRPYYIGEKRLITLMMKMDADMVAMTMPDLEQYHIKRSYVRKDIEYLYIPHGVGSNNLMFRKGALDYYDTIFCTGKNQKEEAEETERVYNLPPKNNFEWGYDLLDEMRRDYAKTRKQEKTSDRKKVLIAPSWQPDNIVDSCLEEILDQLKEQNYDIIVRPHPQHVRHKGEYMEGLKKKYENNANILIQTDFSSNSTVFEADMLITDWSSIGYEYAFTTQRPILYINTPMKVMNPEYEKVKVEPIDIWIRNEIGCALELDELDQIAPKVSELVNNQEKYFEKIGAFIEEYVYNLDCSAEVGGKYIIKRLQQKAKERKGEKEL